MSWWSHATSGISGLRATQLSARSSNRDDIGSIPAMNLAVFSLTAAAFLAPHKFERNRRFVANKQLSGYADEARNRGHILSQRDFRAPRHRGARMSRSLEHCADRCWLFGREKPLGDVYVGRDLPQRQITGFLREARKRERRKCFPQHCAAHPCSA
jgi:hypothetical protein